MDSYFKALANVLKKFENDTQVQYHAFYSILNFIATVEIKMDDKQPKLEYDCSEEQFVNQISKLKINQLDYYTLTFCLIQSGLLRLILDVPMKADEEVMRIKMKLVTTMLFKPLQNRNIIIKSV